MSLIELFLIAVGLSMDAFAISICKGLSVEKLRPKHMIITGLWFGGSQIAMPLIGYFLGSGFLNLIESIDHWIAFGLLALIGIEMIRESRKPSEALDDDFSPKVMFPLAIADSIDALAAGVSFAVLEVNIIPAVLFIGLTTFSFSAVGVKIGNLFGERYRSVSEVIGGVILIAMGTKILLEHLGILVL